MSKAARMSLPVAHSRPAAIARRAIARAALAVGFVVPATAGAQAWAYPSFQPPRVMNREFNFGVADAGDAGTSLIFQWREGLSAQTQLSLDVGFADPDGKGNGKLLLGGQFGYLFTQANAEMPLDFLGTAGVNFAFGDGANIVRIPFGVSIGHRFPLEDNFAITPYVHPRVSIDICSDCGGPDNNDSETDLGIDFDLGANFEVTKQLSFRVSALFGGSDTFGDSDGFGISLAWTPPGLSKLSKLIRR
jgi:hypothetical protein